MSPGPQKAKGKKKRKAKPQAPQVVVPLLPSLPVQPPAPPMPPQKMKIWYLIRGTTIGGMFLVGLGTAGFVFYLTTDKDHRPETALLWVSVGFIAAGFHFISRQSVRNFIKDAGAFLPWGKKNGDTSSDNAVPPGGGG